MNQTKRLIENCDRAAIDIRYSSYQNLGGRQVPTNVSIDCNSGAYMSAIKPALEQITQGWHTEVCNTLITCEEIIGRTDLSGRKVSTKLVLYLTENSQPTIKQKVVLHFHHTSSSVQAQGSSLLSCGTSSPVWLSKNFLEPSANMHVNQNRGTINAINTQIRQEGSSSCNHCNNPIHPTASQPKDQELQCSKCSLLYHKKCTDRNKSKGNWRKSPWFCEKCILGLQPYHAPEPDPVSAQQIPVFSLSHNTAVIPQAHSAPVPAPQGPLHIDQEGHIESAPDLSSVDNPRQAQTQQQHHGLQQISDRPQPDLHHHEIPNQPDNAVVNHEVLNIESVSGLRNISAPVSQNSSASYQRSVPAFPSLNTRQRSSNINTENPDLEFQQTALSACRSTIAQQESEIKRLKEGLDIRNKRILQLESQIGEAADHIAGRDNIAYSATNGLQPILSRLNNIESKIASLSTQTSNNIVIHSGMSQPYLKGGISAMTQTDPNISFHSENNTTSGLLAHPSMTQLYSERSENTPPSPTPNL